MNGFFWINFSARKKIETSNLILRPSVNCKMRFCNDNYTRNSIRVIRMKNRFNYRNFSESRCIFHLCLKCFYFRWNTTTFKKINNIVCA